LTTSTVIELRDGALRTYEVDPKSLGVAHASADDVRGGDVNANVDLAKRVLGGEKLPHRDLVLLNAAAGLIAAGVVDDLACGIDAGAEAIDHGRAAAVLDDLVRTSQECAG
jgi:anthranilate phosphoribosyltransferase